MDGLQIAVGTAARDALCHAFSAAHHDIDAEYFSISDRSVVASLNAAAVAGVHVRLHVEAHPRRYQKHAGDAVKSERSLKAELAKRFDKRVEIVLEDDPASLTHGKAAVVDGATAYICTANPTWTSFENPGAVLVTDGLAADVRAVAASIEHKTAAPSDHIVAGPSADLRECVGALFCSDRDLSVASEDLSDPWVVEQLVERSTHGHHDRVLVGDRFSTAQKRAVTWLERSGVEVHMLARGFMHEKYVDDGVSFYVGSANLTHNGLDESRELGIVADSTVAQTCAATLRADFDTNWSNSVRA